MKILIHGLGVVQGGGLSHLRSFLSALDQAGGENEYTVLVRKACAELLPELSHIKVEPVPDDWTKGFRRLWVENIAIPMKIEEWKYDLLISVANFGPIRVSVPHIVFQRNALYFSKEFLALCSPFEKCTTLLRRWYVNAIMRNAQIIVVPTMWMANAIRKALPGSVRYDIRILYHAVDATVPRAPRVAREGERIKIFYPAHAYSHKGFPALFKIISCLTQKDLRRYEFILTIVPKDLPVLERDEVGFVLKNGLDKHIRFVGPLSQTEVQSFYKTCDLLIFPSSIESFGFPLIEAMICGLPIVAADSPVSREICGDAALYFDSSRAECGAALIEEALSPGGQEHLRTGRSKRLASFDWSWARYVQEFSQMIKAFEKPAAA